MDSYPTPKPVSFHTRLKRVLRAARVDAPGVTAVALVRPPGMPLMSDVEDLATLRHLSRLLGEDRVRAPWSLHPADEVASPQIVMTPTGECLVLANAGNGLTVLAYARSGGSITEDVLARVESAAVAIARVLAEHVGLHEAPPEEGRLRG